MGKPAARARIDSSAHTGPIQSGSSNVIIGGVPAARKGYPLSCSQHGRGSILSGSTTV
ncbi:PAAR domain-containing protein, partial [Enterobacter hormaechei]